MGTHIIWRNPSPPRKVEFKLRRVAGNQVASVYQVASPNYRHPFELIRGSAVWIAKVAATRKAGTGSTPPGAELVSAWW
jgi:hypothetical protein